MKKGEKIDINKIGCREFNAEETLKQLMYIGSNAQVKFMCWGATNFTVDKKNNIGLSKALRFKVNGLTHKGYVYIALGFSDTYDVYFVKNDGCIIEKKTNIYFDMLNETIDDFVEKEGNEDYKF